MAQPKVKHAHRKRSCASRTGRWCCRSTAALIGLAVAVPALVVAGAVVRGLYKDVYQGEEAKQLAEAVVEGNEGILHPLIATGTRPATCGHYHKGNFLNWLPAIHAPVLQGADNLEDLLRLCSADLHEDDAHFHNVLHQAAASTDGSRVKAVLKVAGEIGLTPKLIRGRRMMGDTPLHVAAAWKNAEAVEALLDAGTDPDSINWLGVTALHNAALANDVASVRALLLHGADGDIVALGYTPQDLALTFGSSDAYVLLQQHREARAKYSEPGDGGGEPRDEL